MLTVTAAAVAEPISLAEAKEHLRVFGSGNDTLIAGLISTAREHVERYTGRALAVASYTFASTDETAWALPLWPARLHRSLCGGLWHRQKRRGIFADRSAAILAHSGIDDANA